MTDIHTGLDSPRGIWWKPAHRNEKLWVSIAFACCMVLFAMMPLWHWKGGQNPSGVRRRVEPAAFYQRTQEFITQYKVGEDHGIPIVAPPPGSDIYLAAMTYQWTPILAHELLVWATANEMSTALGIAELINHTEKAMMSALNGMRQAITPRSDDPQTIINSSSLLRSGTTRFGAMLG